MRRPDFILCCLIRWASIPSLIQVPLNSEGRDTYHIELELDQYGVWIYVFIINFCSQNCITSHRTVGFLFTKEFISFFFLYVDKKWCSDSLTSLGNVFSTHLSIQKLNQKGIGNGVTKIHLSAPGLACMIRTYKIQLSAAHQVSKEAVKLASVKFSAQVGVHDGSAQVGSCRFPSSLDSPHCHLWILARSSNTLLSCYPFLL